MSSVTWPAGVSATTRGGDPGTNVTAMPAASTGGPSPTARRPVATPGVAGRSLPPAQRGTAASWRNTG